MMPIEKKCSHGGSLKECHLHNQPREIKKRLAAAEARVKELETYSSEVERGKVETMNKLAAAEALADRLGEALEASLEYVNEGSCYCIDTEGYTCQHCVGNRMRAAIVQWREARGGGKGANE